MSKCIAQCPSVLRNVQVYCAMPKWLAQLSRCVAKVPNPVKLHFFTVLRNLQECCAMSKCIAQCQSGLCICPSVLPRVKILQSPVIVMLTKVSDI